MRSFSASGGSEFWPRLQEGDFSFTYDATWVTDPERFALSPYLPLPGERDPARLPRA